MGIESSAAMPVSKPPTGSDEMRPHLLVTLLEPRYERSLVTGAPTLANQTYPSGPRVEVQEPHHVTGTAPYVGYGIRITGIGGPVTVELARKILALLPESVPADAQIQWGYPDVWISWRRHDPLGEYEHVG